MAICRYCEFRVFRDNRVHIGATGKMETKIETDIKCLGFRG